eukprot:288160-Chlamydomonas_euryale.AAC.1
MGKTGRCGCPVEHPPPSPHLPNPPSRPQVRTDLFAFVGLFAVLAQARYESVVLEVVTLVSASAALVRIVLGYQRMGDRFRAYVNEVCVGQDQGHCASPSQSQGQGTGAIADADAGAGECECEGVGKDEGAGEDAGAGTGSIAI